MDLRPERPEAIASRRSFREFPRCGTRGGRGRRMGCRDRPSWCGGGCRDCGDADRRRIPSARATASSRTRASMNLRIHRLAVAEIDREVDYYQSRQVGLGTELEDEIDAAFSLIVQFPKSAPAVARPTGSGGRRTRSVSVPDSLPDHTFRHRHPRARTHKPSTRLLGEASYRWRIDSPH